MGAVVDVALAEEPTNAYATKTIVSVPLSSRAAGFDLATACAIEAELTQGAEGAGRNSLGAPRCASANDLSDLTLITTP